MAQKPTRTKSSAPATSPKRSQTRDPRAKASDSPAGRGPAGYSGTPLPKKLGIKDGVTVLLIEPPDRFAETLGALPPGARLVRSASSPVRTILLFARTQSELAARFEKAATALASPGALWVVWPKKTSPLARDLGENEIRAFALARGFVDYKVCAVDKDWSGLALARRTQ